MVNELRPYLPDEDSPAAAGRQGASSQDYSSPTAQSAHPFRGIRARRSGVGKHLILDRYELIGTAGSGGFGTVQIAWDPRIQRKVAIKTIQLTEQDAYRAGLPGAQAVMPVGAGEGSTADRWHGVQPWNEFLAEQDSADDAELDDADVSDSSEAVDEFHALAHVPGLDEARTAALLSDPRIVTVFDFEVRGQVAYLIMEYVEGVTLTRMLRDYADWLTLDVVAAVFDSVAGALEVAHESNVLHLDIKPDNILVNAKGEVKVTDFGLATLADASGVGTTGGGTIGYMPLEQMRREHLDARADEWALAAVTYEMLTGENPFLADGLKKAEAAIEDAELVLPSLCWQDIDEQIDDVVFYALDPDRDERYASVGDFAEEARKFLGDPKAGKDQLAAIVEDALGLNEEPVADDEPAASEDVARASRSTGRKLGVLSLLKEVVDSGGSASGSDSANRGGAQAVLFDDEDDEEFDEDDYREAGRTRARRGSNGERTALRDRVSTKARTVLAGGFAAVASGAIMAFATLNFPMLAEFGPGQPAIVGAFVLAVAALAVVRADVGALVAFAFLGIALIFSGAVVPAVVLVVALGVWWYFVARKSTASVNVALATPLLGIIGATPAVPLLAGATLRPVQALATTGFAIACSLVLGSLGSDSLFGWNVPPQFLLVDFDSAGRMLRLIMQPSTWCVAASWLGAAAVQSLLSTRGSRAFEIAGIVAAVAIVLAGALVFFVPSVRLIASLAITAVVLLVCLI